MTPSFSIHELLLQIRDSRRVIVEVRACEIVAMEELKMKTNGEGVSQFQMDEYRIKLEEARIALAEAELRLREGSRT